MSQRSVLKLLIDDPLTINQLSMVLGINTSSVHKNLKRLEKRGFVRRMILNNKHYFYITIKGRRDLE
jgi:DNA-binding MarR family transcriptional regulator